ncbi:MAG: hypothetical protein DRP76_03995 [Candidatus Omnitrophota bacterium]|nr:MAG: hypothetical protein DRP76_03995 [Candidatus Omnitrophota bacterium]
MNNKIIIISLIFSLFVSFPSIVSSGEKRKLEKKEEGVLTLDFKGADIRDVLRALAGVGGKNIVVSSKVEGKITMSLKDVNWRDALEMILTTYGLVADYRENYIRVITLEELRREESDLPLELKTFTLKFADAQIVSGIVRRFLGRRGKIEVDASTNTIIVSDIKKNLENIRKIIQDLDTRRPQIFIEAMLLDMKISNEDQLGVEWSVLKEAKGKTHEEQLLYRGAEVNLAATGTMLAIRYGKSILDKTDLDALVNLWCHNKQAEILANPRVLTLDNQEAEISLTEAIPYEQTTITDQGTYTVTQFTEAGVKLKVKPHVTGDLVVSNIILEESIFTGLVGDQPAIDKRSAVLNMAVRSGETIVIGGLRKKDTTETIDKIPLLGDIPGIGHLFRRRIKTVTDTELVLFLTPYVVTQPEMSVSDKEKLKKFEDFRYIKMKRVKIDKELLPPKIPVEK